MRETSAAGPSLKVLLVGLAPNKEFVNILPLGYLKAYADSRPGLKRRADISLRHYGVDDTPLERILAEILSLEPDLVGFSCYDWSVETAFRLTALIKAARPRTAVVLGGPEVAPRPAAVLREVPADYVVSGEGEVTFAQLLERLVDGNPVSDVLGLSWVSKSGPIVNLPRPLMEDLDEIPCPYQTGVFRFDPICRGGAVVESLRGCPFDCEYCTWSDKGRVRFFPVDRVLATVRHLLETSPGLTVFFADSDIFVNKPRAKEILRGILRIAEGKPAVFWFTANLMHLDEELMGLFNDERFVLGAGVESADPTALKACAREDDIKDQERQVALFRRLAPKARLSLQILYGIPGDNLAGYRRSLEWIQAMNPGDCDMFHVQILWGSRLKDRTKELGVVHDVRPPYKVRSAASFPEKDIVEAERLSYSVRFLMTSTPIRRAFQHAERCLPGAWSHLEACEAVAAALEGSGAYSLRQKYADWSRSAPPGGNPVGGHWPENADAAEQMAILSAASDHLKGRLGREAWRRAQAFLDEGGLRIAWRAMAQSPAFGQLIDRLKFMSHEDRDRRLLVCWEHSPDPYRILGGQGRVILLVDKQVGVGRSAVYPADAFVSVDKEDSSAGIFSAIDALGGSYREIVLSNTCLFLPQEVRARLLRALLSRLEAGGRLLVMDGRPVSCGRPEEEIVAALTPSYRGDLKGPFVFEGGPRLPGGELSRWVFLSVRSERKLPRSGRASNG